MKRTLEELKQVVAEAQRLTEELENIQPAISYFDWNTLTDHNKKLVFKRGKEALEKQLKDELDKLLTEDNPELPAIIQPLDTSGCSL